MVKILRDSEQTWAESFILGGQTKDGWVDLCQSGVYALQKLGSDLQSYLMNTSSARTAGKPGEASTKALEEQARYISKGLEP